MNQEGPTERCQPAKDFLGRYKAVLFDLDNTLLENDMGVFIPHFLDAMAPRFAEIIPTESFKRWMLRSVRQMIVSTDPRETVEEVFRRDMVMRSGYSWKVLGPLFDRFYAEDYSGLSVLCRKVPLARPLVEAILARGVTVAVATNPIFPLSAMKERLRWAGLGDLPFAYVTCCEEMHFTKPHPEFYDEVVDRLGLDPEECLMAGDDPENDLPAALAGLETFLLTDFTNPDRRLAADPTYEGKLQDFYRLILGS